MTSPELSVVIPVHNERDALPALLDEIERVCGGLGRSWEIVLVDDGSTDGSTELVERRAGERERMRVLRLRRNFGKSAALTAGFEHSSGEIVVTLDGDGQDDPAEIPALIARLDDGFDVVSGWKRTRRDPPVKRWSSRLFNWVTARLSGIDLHDFNCGFKAYRGRCARSLEFYGELHRYIPVLAAHKGWRVTELPVEHRPRVHGRSKFGRERYVRGLFDLMTVLFIGRYQQRPLHLFGGIGLVLILAGLAVSVYLSILRLSGEGIGDRPLLLLGALLIVVGIQLLTFGLLGQLLAAMAYEGRRSRAAEYQVERVVEGTEHGGEAPERRPAEALEPS
ncbi:MAG: glycosyltransferase family 2 protein [Solirubrobacterales bacterium]